MSIFDTNSKRASGGQPRAEFLEDFPTVSREQAVAALRLAAQALVAPHPQPLAP